MRSPRIAPPVYGLVGSTAMMPTCFAFAPQFVDQSIHQRALARARRAGDADHRGASGVRKELLEQRVSGGPAILDRRCGTGERARIAGENFLGPGRHQLFSSWRAITRRWISLVPSPMVHSFDVAIELLDRIILDEAVAAVDLHRFVGDAHRDLAREQLRHRRFLGDALALILHPRRAIGEQARGFDLGGHVGELVLDGLKLGDRPAELLALLGILERGFVGALRGSDRERGDRDAAAVEDAQAVDESLAVLAEQLRFGQPAVVNSTSPVALARMPSLFSFLPTRNPGTSFFEDESRDAVLRRRAIGDRHGDAHVGVLRVGGERFRAVQHPARAVLHRFACACRRRRIRLQAR